MSMRFEVKKKPVEAPRKPPVGKIAALAIAVLLLIGGSVWGVRETMESRRAAAEWAEFQRLRDLRNSDAYKKMTDEERQQIRKDYRERYEKLPFEKRKMLTQEWANKETKQYEEYANAPEDQRAAVLERQNEEAKKRWAGRGGPGNGQQNGNGKGNNAAAPAAGNSPPPDNSGMSREARRREYLDSTTPEQRAQKSVMRQARREQQQSGR